MNCLSVFYTRLQSHVSNMYSVLYFELICVNIFFKYVLTLYTQHRQNSLIALIRLCQHGSNCLLQYV